MAFILKPAVREKINLLFAIAGESGSGKTFSALTLAKGISGNDGFIVLLDLEAGRSTHYAPNKGSTADLSKGTFDFLRIDFPAPFTPERFIEAIKEALKINPTTIIIDNFSQEWDGDGGILQIVDDSNANGLSAWKQPRTRHNKLMNFILQTKCNFIFCLRAKDKKTYIINDSGKKEVVNKGYLPICDDKFMYEMTGFITLSSHYPGYINYDFPKKLNDQIINIFENKKRITISHGQKLKEWAESGCYVGAEKQIDKALNWVNSQKNIFQSCGELSAFNTIVDHQNYISAVERLRDSRPELAKDLQQYEDETKKRLGQTVAPFEQTGEQEHVQS